jgi:hypothetical protein
VDLVHLADPEGNAVHVTVLGPHPHWPEALAAQIVVATPFVQGMLDLAVWPRDLAAWSAALDRLAAGDDISWMQMSRGPTLSIRLHGERDCPEITVEDEYLSMVTVRVPVDLEDGWIEDHRVRLAAVTGSPGPAVLFDDRA